MGESACLMHSFSYTSGISNEAKQGNPIQALGESISFGRFVSESLSWEKWSTFSHNRYVEDAQRYAQPGSVAQKKAFFEAHYRKIAAQKAAALLEQANLATNTNPEPETEGQACDNIASSHEGIGEQLEVKNPDIEVEPIVNVSRCNSRDELEEEEDEIGKVKGAESLSDEVETESPVKSESSNQVEKNVFEQNAVSEMKLGESPQMEEKKPLLEGFKTSQEDPCPVSKRKPAIQPSKSSIHRRAPKVPAAPSKPTSSVNPIKHNIVTPITGKSPKYSTDRKRSTSKSLCTLIYSAPPQVPDKSTTPQMEKPSLEDSKCCKKAPSAIAKKKLTNLSSKSQVEPGAPKVPPSPAKQTAGFHPRKENNVTPITRDSPIDTLDKKRPASKSLHTLIYSTPAKEPDKSTTPAAQKVEKTPRVATGISKQYKTPLRTPIMTNSNGVVKNPSATPLSENRSCSKSLSACRNKLQSPTLSIPFSLRTEERAARRKQKLEEKFNAKESEKIQLQTRLKEKAGTELRRLRQTLCFKARPLPDFYKERGAPKDQIKNQNASIDQIKNENIPLTYPQSPKLGRKGSANTLQGMNPLPPERHTTKNSGPKNVLKRKSQIPNPVTSLPETSNHENQSPNIQQ